MTEVKMTKKRRLNTSSEGTGTLFIAPYAIAFMIFITIPVAMGMLLSLTYFNLLEAPRFTFETMFSNYIFLFTADDVFMQKVIPNTVQFALFVGPIGYMLGFFLAWMLAQIPHRYRTFLALVIYSPSMTAGVAMSVMWRIIFSGDEAGYLNAILLQMQLIDEPIQWLTNPDFLLPVMIVVTLWSSMGIGFLAMLAGVLNINQELYEAAYIDGIKNRTQEILYITIPSMRPQMLFGAVMAVVNTFQAGAIGVTLSGSNPTPQYAGQLIVNHIEDFGFIRYMMGYASAVSVVLLLMVYILSKVTFNLLGDKE